MEKERDMSGGYTDECISILNQEYRSTDNTGELLLPILNEIIDVKNCYDRDLLCEKLLIEAKLFNKLNIPPIV